MLSTTINTGLAETEPVLVHNHSGRTPLGEPELRCLAEDLEGEPVGVRTFTLMRNLSWPSIFGLSGWCWDIGFIEQIEEPCPYQCAANYSGKRRTITRQMLAMVQRGNETIRFGEVRPIFELGYGWLRPAAYRNPAWERRLARATREEIRNFDEPMLSVGDTGREVQYWLRCACFNPELGVVQLLRMSLRLQFVDVHEELGLGPVFDQYRVRFIGRAEHWPVSHERARMMRDYHPDQWLVRAELRSAEACFVVQAHDHTTLIEWHKKAYPITYFKLPSLNLAA